ncbi:hypothetical protein WN944_019011 [Citrus x changshan-huyou]|uniref:DUF1985 domain-containing protein n=1 Tax=Citrus x changshan-huyou TaxID=2935761 RepID=A0AAP0LUF8_9ROSI
MARIQRRRSVQHAATTTYSDRGLDTRLRRDREVEVFVMLSAWVKLLVWCMGEEVVVSVEEEASWLAICDQDDIFDHFLECRSIPFSGVILHNVLLRQVAHGEYRGEDQLWFQIDTAQTNNKTVHRLLNTYFDGLFRNITLKQFDALFEELDFKAMDDIDTLKIALFYFADRVLNGRKGYCQINFSWLNEVDDIDHFRNRPWGRLSWETIYESLHNALNEKDEKFKKT